MVRFVHHYWTFWSYKFLLSGFGVFFKVSILTITMNTCLYLKKRLLFCERSSWSSSGTTEKRQSLIKQSNKNLTRCVKTWGEWCIVYIDAFIINTVSWPRHRIRKDARFWSVYTKPIKPFSRCFPMWLFKQELHSVVVHHVYYSLTSQFVPKVVTVCKTMRSCRLNDERNQIILKTLHVW